MLRFEFCQVKVQGLQLPASGEVLRSAVEADAFRWSVSRAYELAARQIEPEKVLTSGRPFCPA
jgi:hypothetical protein